MRSRAMGTSSCACNLLSLFSELSPQAPIRNPDGVRHYSLEEEPERIAALVTVFLRQT